ncbi:hypothetical protein E2C01_034589 [Portunus trituberculatus]|uniref:Uncharacterized protein n=1 Tax=Portunus trituberculatus TaxID=210409 RepID=A0A5B7F710_PORTR|nr:hypothetical protein [Portunus trituberculatus]
MESPRRQLSVRLRLKVVRAETDHFVYPLNLRPVSTPVPQQFGTLLAPPRSPNLPMASGRYGEESEEGAATGRKLHLPPGYKG